MIEFLKAEEAFLEIVGDGMVLIPGASCSLLQTSADELKIGTLVGAIQRPLLKRGPVEDLGVSCRSRDEDLVGVELEEQARTVQGVLLITTYKGKSSKAKSKWHGGGGNGPEKERYETFKLLLLSA